MSNEVRFREVQRFRQWWLWALLVVSLAPVVTLGPLGVVLVGVLVLLVWSFRLTTEVRDDGVYVKFFPFHLSFRRVPWQDIDAHEAITYRPIRDYGGWGVRWSRGKTAYNVSGSRGVYLTRPDDRDLMIGSQRPDELDGAIGDAMRARR